ncbi:MAG: DUF3467 domain-containing protein [Planctomycetia bacterium]|nr:DUF3467 domain-containing protein [Planctomycetia bacterium]
MSTAALPNTEAAPAAPQPIKVDETKLVAAYTNFCRVTGTPEELIVDFGLNAHPMGSGDAVVVGQRLVMNYFTAKRLLQALGMSVARHEQVFGTLETNVMRRAEKK